MNNIKRLSERMQILFETLLILAPLAVIAYWTFFEFFSFIGLDYFFPHQLLTINVKSKILAILVMSIPTGIVMYGLFKLKKLFTNYAANQIFTQDNVLIYRKLGIALFALVIADIVNTPLLSLALSFQNPVGSRFVSLGFGLTEIITLIIGFIVMTISYVMHRAFELEQEAKQCI